MKKMLIALLVLTISIWACGGGGDGGSGGGSGGSGNPSPSPSPSESPLERDWTYMVYMGGDTNLSSFAIKDLNEMEKVGSTEDVAIVTQTEFSSKYTPEIGKFNTYRIYVEKDSDETMVTSLDSAEDIGNVDMTDPAQLTSFIEWAVTNYPAKYYALVLWSHGDGWRTVPLMSKSAIVDETSSPDASMMLNSKIAQAITSAEVELNVLDFDVCLMGMYEVLYEFTDKTDYIVASAESIPGDGLPYDMVLTELTNNPAMTPEELAVTTVNKYYDFYFTQNRSNALLSAYDMSRFYSFDEKMRELATLLANNIGMIKPNIQSMQDSIISYTFVQHRDLGQFINDLTMLSDTAIASKAGEVKALIDDMIVNHKVFTANGRSGYSARDISGSTGLAIYFPKAAETSEDNKSNYEGLSVNQSGDSTWYKFLFNSYLAGETIPSPYVCATPFYFELTWSPAVYDLDLYVIEPNGSVASPWLGLISPNGAYLSGDSLYSGYAVELYVSGSCMPRGNYIVVVNLYTDVSTYASITAYDDGAFYLSGPRYMNLSVVPPAGISDVDFVSGLISDSFSNWWMPGYLEKNGRFSFGSVNKDITTAQARTIKQLMENKEKKGLIENSSKLLQESFSE